MSNARTTSRTTAMTVRVPNEELERVTALRAIRKLTFTDAVLEALAAWPPPTRAAQQQRAGGGKGG